MTSSLSCAATREDDAEIILNAKNYTEDIKNEADLVKKIISITIE